MPSTVPELAAILRQVRRLELRSERQVDALMLGAYRAMVRGQGMEFEELRDYHPGDDIRHIDWNVTARSGGRRAYVKVYREERARICRLILDVSGSMCFGAIPGLSPRTKLQTAAEAAAIIGVVALRNRDLLGLTTFSNRRHLHLPCRSGRGHIMHILRCCLAADATAHPTCLTLALEELHRTQPRRALCVLISDFLRDEVEFATTLRRVARRHEIIGLRIDDPGERSLPEARAPLVMRDPESQDERVLVGGPAAAARYHSAYQAQRQQVRQAFTAAGCDLIDLGTEVDCFATLHRALTRRRRHG